MTSVKNQLIPLCCIFQFQFIFVQAVAVYYTGLTNLFYPGLSDHTTNQICFYSFFSYAFFITFYVGISKIVCF